MSVTPTAPAPGFAIGSQARSGRRLGEAALWAGAAIVAIAVHAGLGWWILAEPRAELPPTPAPGAITFELAAMPVAPETEPHVAPGPRMTQQDEAPQPEEPPQELQPPEPEPEPVPEPEPQPEPEPEPEPEPRPEPEPERVEELPEADPPIEPDVEIPVPTPRPAYTPPPQPPEPPAPEPPRERQAPPPQRQAAPQTSAPAAQAPAPAAAAPVQSSPQASTGVSPQRWQGQLLAHLERRKRYPSGARSRGEQGTAQLTFSIDRAGNIVSARLSRSSGFAELDQAVIDMISRASPVPPPPQSVTQLTFTVPVEFSLR